MRKRVPGRRRPAADQHQREQRDRRREAQPGEQVEHRRALGAPQQQIADCKAHRRNHQHGEGLDAEIIADGGADHQQADDGNCDAERLHRRRPFSKHDHGKGNREQRLALHDHRGQADRHAVRDAIGLCQELAEKQREADRDQKRPGHFRLAHEQAWHRRNAEPQGRHQRRRKFVERDAACDKGKSPDDRHQDGETDVGRLHCSWLLFLFASPARLASVSSRDKCRAAARDSRPTRA